MTDTGAEHLTPTQRARLEQVEGGVFNIQRYSLHDGPGVRTNVFLKGCPLHCPWCANPESQLTAPQLALYANRCINCGQFATACPVGWGVHFNGSLSPELQEEYSARAAVCPSGAMHWMGTRRTAGDVMQEVLRDVPFYFDNGGMTVTGGEPTLQPLMATALLRLAKAEQISTAIETSGYTVWEVLERLLPYVDGILFDLKHLDSDTHRAFTGVGNERILANLQKLAAANAPVTVRVPLIPGFNATEGSLRAIAQFIANLAGPVRGVDILPYHTFGRSKYKALGRSYPWAGHDRLTEQAVEDAVGLMKSYGLNVNVGG
jgi:pyruvate formate lyase activating enzyme